MATLAVEPESQIREVSSDDEARDIFEQAAQYYLKMSGRDFIKRWNAHEFEAPDQPDIMHVAALLPLVQ